MISEENYKITPAICTRVAILVCCCTLSSHHYLTGLQREAYSKFPDADFWDQVDKILDSIKSMPEEKRFRFVVSIRLDGSRSSSSRSRYLKAVLSRDRRMFGVAPGAVAALPGDDTTAGGESLMQQRIEDFIEAPGGATMFSAPQNVVDT